MVPGFAPVVDSSRGAAAAEGGAPFGQHTLLRLLRLHGLRATEKCLIDEAKLDAETVENATSTAPPALSEDLRELELGQSTSDDARQRLADLSEGLEAHQSRLEGLQKYVREASNLVALRAQRSKQAGPEQGGDSLGRQNVASAERRAALAEEFAQAAVELAEERSSLEKEEQAEAELRSELALVVGRVALLTGALEAQAALPEAAEAPSEMGIPVLTAKELHVDQGLARLLEKWDSPGGAKEIVASVYRETEKDPSGRLLWTNGGVRKFISRLFKRLSMAVPEWSDEDWIQEYQSCEKSLRGTRTHVQNAGLNQQEGVQFAHHCLNVLHMQRVDRKSVV